ncbi:ABC transporter permease [Cellulosimicrobium arenosum]|uniref:ABC transporter permease n=1 Tax=Cellulosimicrobium arenosum TaxID=2708133 RepID=A0A927GA53_9MICO|nr:ABC transporter permease [Cellulosimicrobium arenosum]MBD8079428.1 ABC transporter permease [Cellulosimicrobium arenosum]
MMMKEFRELRRDKRTLAMLVALPLLLLIVFGYAANFTVDELKVAVVGSQADAVVDMLEGADGEATGDRTLDVVSSDPGGSDGDARDQLRDDHADLAIVTGDALSDDASGAAPIVYIDGSNLFAAQSANVLMAGLGDQVTSEILYNPDLETSWVMVPALIGLILTFIGTIITSIGLVREREAGTLEQLAVMPFSSSQVILGKITPYFLLACFDMAVVTLLGMWIFGVPFVGSVVAFVLGAAIFLFVVLGLGVLISTVSQTTGQAVQVALMTLLPQVLLSGMIFPLDAMAAGVRWIGYVLPLTWFTKISQGVMLRDASWDYLWLPLVILAVMAVVIFGAATLRLGREISPKGAR